MQIERKENWFEKRRDLFVRETVDSFFQIMPAFHSIYLVYIDCLRLHRDKACADLVGSEKEASLGKIWDQLQLFVGTEADKGPLWQLKDLCHKVWPENREDQDVNGRVVDWLLGSVFHEAMKLKENIYLLNSYGPAAHKIEAHSAGSATNQLLTPSLTPYLMNVVDVSRLINRIGRDVMNQMEQIAFLLGQINYLLRMMMPGLARNMLLVRLLVEREDRVQQLWGESLEDIFGEMFFGDATEGFCAAGRSYLQGQWYLKSLEMYQRALSIDRQCDEAIMRVAQLQAIVNENQEILGVA